MLCAWVSFENWVVYRHYIISGRISQFKPSSTTALCCFGFGHTTLTLPYSVEEISAIQQFGKEKIYCLRVNYQWCVRILPKHNSYYHHYTGHDLNKVNREVEKSSKGSNGGGSDFRDTIPNVSQKLGLFKNVPTNIPKSTMSCHYITSVSNAVTLYVNIHFFS